MACVSEQVGIRPPSPSDLTWEGDWGRDKQMVISESGMEELTLLKGLLAGGITMGLAAVFPEALVLPFFTAVLGLMAGVYPGVAMADPLVGSSSLQWTAAAGFLVLGLVGLWTSPLLLAGAWLLHWVWSFLHRFTALGDGVPDEYPGFCLSYDLVMAGFVSYMWGVGG